MYLLLVVLLAVVPQSVIGLRRTGNVITVDSCEWQLNAPKVKIDAKSAITINFMAEIAPQSDSIHGPNLWRLGIFGSKYTDGHGEKVGFRDQILLPKQASKQPRKGKPLKLKNVLSRFDLSQIGCGEFRYFCVELAKNPDSTVDFELLRAGIILDSIVTCKELECQRPNVNATAEAQVIVCSFWWKVTKHFRYNAPSEVSLNISVGVAENSAEIIGGKNLWQVGFYGSRYKNGDDDEKLNFNQQVLDESASLNSPDIRPGGNFVFPIMPFQFDFSAIGCGEYRYLCVVLAKGPSPKPDFEIVKGDATTGKVVSCLRSKCTSPAARPPTVFMRNFTWDFSVVEDNFTIDVNVVPAPDTDTIRGQCLWRIGIFLSNTKCGLRARSQYHPDILNAADKAKPLVGGGNLTFTDLHVVLNTSEVGCIGDTFRYLCLEFAQGENPVPSYYLRLGRTYRFLSCIRLPCLHESSWVSRLLNQLKAKGFHIYP